MKTDIIDQFIQLSGPLFEDVQQSGIFPDSKLFVDSIPKADPQTVLKKYEKEKKKAHFNLKAFVERHFHLPYDNKQDSIESRETMYRHIEQLWDDLSRPPDEKTSNSTLIPLPYPYIVPGGRFREMYYWDTYFTAEGLAASGRLDLVQNLCRNFSYLIEKVGHVPNGNRYYYISRSQPPFLALLVDLITRKKSIDSIQEFIPALKKEYAFWMDGSASLSTGNAHRRVVNINGSIFNRYWDDQSLPREESWREDVELVAGTGSERPADRYRHIRAGAESGWDFSSRWLADGHTLATIQTTDILPVDLNALLCFLERKLAEWTDDRTYIKAAEQRKTAFDHLFWNDESGFYFDYDWKEHKQTEIWSLAGTYPLFTEISSSQQVHLITDALRTKFLMNGGLVSTLHETGQQWDYPNGWAPLQWIAVRGLMNYGRDSLARTITERWLNLNETVFNRTGKMMEKYNVCDLSLEAGGGEYLLQDGFGWTNGVAVALKNLFKN